MMGGQDNQNAMNGVNAPQPSRQLTVTAAVKYEVRHREHPYTASPNERPDARVSEAARYLSGGCCDAVADASISVQRVVACFYRLSCSTLL